MIVHRTDGLIDMRSFTTMGVNAKPRTDAPIGYFGTGLKYAIAVLVRLGATPVVHVGSDRYTFEARPMDFRGKTFQQLRMRRDRLGLRGRYTDLPFTTEYGRNWEMWMAFRELHSNTIDEGGLTEEIEAGGTWRDDGNQTTIVVDHPAYDAAFHERGSTFVDLSDRPVLGTLSGVQVLGGKSQTLFYQGMRAKDCPRPTLMTYNFTTGQSLTEDRQLASEYSIRQTLANAIATSDDEALITRVITADSDHWEHGLEPGSWISPSAAFHRVMMRRERGTGVGFSSYYGRHDTRPEPARQSLWVEAPRPWRADDGDVADDSGTPLFAKPYDMALPAWRRLSASLVAHGNAHYGDPSVRGDREMIEEDLWPEDEGPFAAHGPDVELVLRHRDTGEVVTW